MHEQNRWDSTKQTRKEGVKGLSSHPPSRWCSAFQQRSHAWRDAATHDSPRTATYKSTVMPEKTAQHMKHDSDSPGVTYVL